jgi:uncharacterized protein with ParB-like and HNH nuclease domain
MAIRVDPATHPISWFRDRNIEQTLILRPPYQRKPVWTENQKAYLIDTILKNYHIPEIYIHRETDSKGKSVFNVVDGQQRIRSILDFISGSFSLLEDFNPEYPEYSFDDLPDDVKKSFWDYTVYVREITGATEEEVRNIFKRMNRNVVALNPQELRHATYSGEFIRLMEEIAEDEFWTENKIVKAGEIRRMNDVQFVSELFIGMLNGIQDKNKDLDKFYAIYESPGKFNEKSRWNKEFEQIVDMITKLLPNLKDTRWKYKADFYTLFLVLHEISIDSHIPEKNYLAVNKCLSEFANQIDEVINARSGSYKKIKPSVKNYANAVVKSTTDKDRRLSRHKIVLQILSKYTVKK